MASTNGRSSLRSLWPVLDSKWRGVARWRQTRGSAVVRAGLPSKVPTARAKFQPPEQSSNRQSKVPTARAKFQPPEQSSGLPSKVPASRAKFRPPEQSSNRQSKVPTARAKFRPPEQGSNRQSKVPTARAKFREFSTVCMTVRTGWSGSDRLEQLDRFGSVRIVFAAKAPVFLMY